MAKGQPKNRNKKIQKIMAISKQCYHTRASPEYPNTIKEQEPDLKAKLIKIIDAFGESFQEIQENSIKHLDARMVQYMKIHYCNPLYKQTKIKEMHDHLTRC